jgi:hypothetical protein
MINLGIRTVRNTEIYDFGVSEDYLLGKMNFKKESF